MFITARKRSLRRFLHLSVNHYVHGGRGCLPLVWRGPVKSEFRGVHPGQTPLQADTPWADTPPQALWDTVNKRAVRILLECILVIIWVCTQTSVHVLRYPKYRIWDEKFKCCLIEETLQLDERAQYLTCSSLSCSADLRFPLFVVTAPSPLGELSGRLLNSLSSLSTFFINPDEARKLKK